MPRVRPAVAVLCVAGLGIAAYLTYTHYAGVAPVCTSGGCEKVQTSRYATLAGVPVAAIGLAGWALLLGLTATPGATAALLSAAGGIAGAAFAGYLLWAQLARIHAVCVWCVANDSLVALVALLCIVRFLYENDTGAVRNPE
jgi:uncharacterized membrane protein